MEFLHPLVLMQHVLKFDATANKMIMIIILSTVVMNMILTTRTTMALMINNIIGFVQLITTMMIIPPTRITTMTWHWSWHQWQQWWWLWSNIYVKRVAKPQCRQKAHIGTLMIGLVIQQLLQEETVTTMSPPTQQLVQ